MTYRARLASVIALGACSIVSGCGSRGVETASSTPSQPQVNGAAALSGTIGGRPFVAQSALLLNPNQAATKCSSVYTTTNGCSTATDGWSLVKSDIYIFERAVTCADVRNGYPKVDTQPGEHIIELTYEGSWPAFPGSIWHTDEPEPARDQISAFFQRSGAGGAVAGGRVQFLQATPGDGVVSLDLVSKNMALDTSGFVRGTIPFQVCR